MLDRYDVTNDASTAEEARKLFESLTLIFRSAARKGVIPRGVMPDKHSHYSDSSVDQYTMFVYGIWRYFHSGVAREDDRREIRAMYEAILSRLESDRFDILSDEAQPIKFGDLSARYPSRAERLLAILLAGADVTGSPHWARSARTHIDTDTERRAIPKRPAFKFLARSEILQSVQPRRMTLIPKVRAGQETRHWASARETVILLNGNRSILTGPFAR